MATRKHKDVEYAVEDGSGKERIFKTFDEAAAFALGMAVSRGEADLDVLIHSTWGAKFYGGEDAVAQYKEDPEASVFERFNITVNNAGRVP
jgi:hypothetical protein